MVALGAAGGGFALWNLSKGRKACGSSKGGGGGGSGSGWEAHGPALSSVEMPKQRGQMQSNPLNTAPRYAGAAV